MYRSGQLYVKVSMKLLTSWPDIARRQVSRNFFLEKYALQKFPWMSLAKTPSNTRMNATRERTVFTTNRPPSTLQVKNEILYKSQSVLKVFNGASFYYQIAGRLHQRSWEDKLIVSVDLSSASENSLNRHGNGGASLRLNEFPNTLNTHFTGLFLG